MSKEAREGIIITSYITILYISISSAYSFIGYSNTIMLQHISFSVPAVVLFSGAAFILYFLLQFILDPLRDIPGPFLARFTRLWYFIEIYKGSFQLTEIDLHNKYGSIVRIAPHEYSIDDVDAAKTIYGLGNPFPKV